MRAGVCVCVCGKWHTIAGGAQVCFPRLHYLDLCEGEKTATSHICTKNSQDAQNQACLSKTAMTNKIIHFPVEGKCAHHNASGILRSECRPEVCFLCHDSVKLQVRVLGCRFFPASSTFLLAISAFSFRLSWLGFRFACCLSLQIQGSRLWLPASCCFNKRKQTLQANVLELNTFTASRAVFGP